MPNNWKNPELEKESTPPPEIESRLLSSFSSFRFLGDVFETYISRFFGFFAVMLGGNPESMDRKKK